MRNHMQQYTCLAYHIEMQCYLKACAESAQVLAAGISNHAMQCCTLSQSVHNQRTTP